MPGSLTLGRPNDTVIAGLLPRPLTRPSRRVKRSLRLNLWVPITAIGWMLTPVVVLTLPVVMAGSLARGLDPRRVSAVLRVFMALSGTQIEIQSRRANVRIQLI